MVERTVVIEFLDGTSMKAEPETWQGLIDCLNKGGEAVGILGDKVETLIPLSAIKRAYRAAPSTSDQEPLKVKRIPKFGRR